EKSILDFREPIQSSPQTTERMQPRVGSLHEPTIDAKSTAMLGASGSQFWLDAQPTQYLPQRFGIIAAITCEPLGFLPLGSWLASDRRHIHQDFQGLGDFVDVGRSYRCGQGDTLTIGHHVMLAARFAPIRGIWAGIFASFRRLGKGGVDQSAAPVDLVSAIQFGQQHRMQLHPHAGLVPSLQVVSAGLAATKAQFRRQVVPSDTRLEDEQNTGEDLAVIQGLASWKAKTTLGRRRQQRFETIPQRIGNKHSHGTPPRVLKTPSPGHRAAARVPNDSKFLIFSERSKDQRNGREPRPTELVICEPSRRYPFSTFEQFAAPTAEAKRAEKISLMPLPRT